LISLNLFKIKEIEYRLRLTPAADEEAPYFDQEEPVFGLNFCPFIFFYSLLHLK